jgi:hypothetical protein
MLESRDLLIKTWTSAHVDDLAGELARRFISESKNGSLLGFARRLSAGRWEWLRVFLGRPASLQIHETEDESLLATVRPRGVLSPGWDILDADGKPIGSWRFPRRTSEGAFGNLIPPPVEPWIASLRNRPISLERSSFGRKMRFLSVLPGGLSTAVELATLEQRDDGLLLSFAAELDPEPLAKLFLLALVLAD